MLRPIWVRLMALIRPQQTERDLGDELQEHLRLEVERHIASGMPRAEAEAVARRSFGNVGMIQESARDSWRIANLDDLLRSGRVAVRSLARRPTFVATAIASLALGIGAATTVFAVVNISLLRPLAYRNPEQLVTIGGRQFLANQEIEALRNRARSYSDVGSFSPGWLMPLTGIATPLQLNAAKVSGNFFSMLGTPTILGGTFAIDAETPGNDHVAVLSEALWQSAFDRDPAIVGRSIMLGGQPYRVSGVMSRTFHPVDVSAELWIPMAMDRSEMAWNNSITLGLARLRPDVNVAAASAELRMLAPQIQRDFNHTPDWTRELTLQGLQESAVGGIRPTLMVLLIAVAFLLLIATANVANLMLVRTAERQQELAVRSSLGATARQLSGLLLTECLVLSVAGGALGTAVAFAAVRMLRHILPANFPRLEEIVIDGRVIVAASIVTLAIGALFSLAPALHGLTGTAATRLRAGRTVTARGKRTRGVLVASEVALALILSTGAMLMGRTLIVLNAIDRGLRPDHLLTMHVMSSGNGAARRAYWVDVLGRVRNIPGVRSTATVLHLPMSGRNWGGDVLVDGRPLAPGVTPPRTAWQSVSPDYFTTAGIPMLRGRTFTATDGPDTPLVIAVNRAFADLIFPGEDPVGRRINAGNATQKQMATIIAVVGNVRHDSLNVLPGPEVYVPFAQNSVGATALLVRTTGNPAAMASLIRSQIQAVDRNTPITDIRTMDDVYAGSLQRPRMILILMAFFAGIGMILSAVGIYGVVAYGVRHRLREIGIRMALGADRWSIRRLVAGQGMGYAAGGVLIGLPIALALTRFMRGLVFGVPTSDPVSFVSVPIVLLAVALLASWLPTRLVIRGNPTDVLRE